MSPEQARGAAVDKRADIWAFGCVLFEMLSGKRGFEGNTAAETLVRVLDHEPDWAALPVDTPHSIRTLLERCLRKDSRKRLQDIGDAVLEIDDLIAIGPRSRPGNVVVVPSRVWERARHAKVAWVLTGTLTLALASAVGVFLWSTRENRAVAPRPTAVTEPALLRLTSNPADMPVTSAHISPDGRHLAFADPAGLHARIIDSGKTQRMAETKGMNVYSPATTSSTKRISSMPLGAIKSGTVTV